MNTEPTPQPLVVAIDGPSGSGKSSTARGVARRLGLDFLDTGAMYRACAWEAARTGAETPEQIAAVVTAAELQVTTDPDDPRISINGTDVTREIRDPEVSATVSRVATVPEVRVDLVLRQQQIIGEATRGIVAEGRDITTVVAPHAPVRVLLVADPDARVARRQAELGEKVDTAQVTDQVIRRDRDDSTVATFTEAAEGVTVVDSTHLSLDEVVDRIVRLAEEAAR
ncbi:(d)CMP kinase [Auraticoccus monumenti]|uniref:Cytidylate kinase n=1 Tax=Auraticoccus monumenti TaxID=675864 RepID=A0A1G7BGD8_9ACTN|nr:(d)CMP kinase [Auraticoccus monumenti]SDE26188.1 cytidylate kinase [Auraticoccus monumenti]